MTKQQLLAEIKATKQTIDESTSNVEIEMLYIQLEQLKQELRLTAMTTATLTESEFIATSDTDCLNPLYFYVPEDLDYIWDGNELVGKNEYYAHCELVNPACVSFDDDCF